MQAKQHMHQHHLESPSAAAQASMRLGSSAQASPARPPGFGAGGMPPPQMQQSRSLLQTQQPQISSRRVIRGPAPIGAIQFAEENLGFGAPMVRPQAPPVARQSAVVEVAVPAGPLGFQLYEKPGGSGAIVWGALNAPQLSMRVRSTRSC